MDEKQPVWPTEIRVTPDRTKLKVSFDNGDSYEIAAELLRVRSPSAEVQGHSPEQRQTVGGKRDVQIMSVTPIGNYAVKIGFDDMHDTGIYSWQTLHEFGAHREALWAEYLHELEEKGMRRDP